MDVMPVLLLPDGGGASRWWLGSAKLPVTVIHPFPHSNDCRESSATSGGGFMAGGGRVYRERDGF